MKPRWIFKMFFLTVKSLEGGNEPIKHLPRIGEVDFVVGEWQNLGLHFPNVKGERSFDAPFSLT